MATATTTMTATMRQAHTSPSPQRRPRESTQPTSRPQPASGLRTHSLPPAQGLDRTVPRRTVALDHSRIGLIETAPVEPTPEQQLAEQLRFVRAGCDAGRGKQPLYRPAVLRRTDTTHLPSPATSSTLTSGVATPNPALLSPSALSPTSLGPWQASTGSGTATPTPPTSGGGGSAPGSPRVSHEPALGGAPLQRKGSLASSMTSLHSKGEQVSDDADSAWRSNAYDDPIRRCGTEWVDGKLVGRMMDKADWTPDSFRTSCVADRCSKRFSIFDRKHHCRVCGEVFCSSCSSARIELLPPSRRKGSGNNSTISSTGDKTPVSAPPAPVTPAPGSPTLSVSSAGAGSLPGSSSSAKPASVVEGKSAFSDGLALTPSRACNTCAASIAFGEDPLATRARKPLLEGSAASSPPERISVTPPTSFPLPLHHHSSKALSPAGSPGRLRTLSGGGRNMSSSDPNVRSSAGGSPSNGGSISGGSSRYSPSNASTATTSPSSSGAPPKTGAPNHLTRAHGQGFYHPFPFGADSEELFASPADESGQAALRLGAGRAKGGKKGGEIIPEQAVFGQVWQSSHPHHDGDEDSDGEDLDDGAEYDDGVDDPIGFEDIGRQTGRNGQPMRRRRRGKVVTRSAGAGGTAAEEEEGQAAFSYQWSTF